MNKTELKIAYEGQLHQIDVDTLITSLLHFAEMINIISAKEMPGEGIDIKITAPEKGSFVLYLELAKASLAGIFGGLFGSPTQSLTSTHNIITMLAGIFTLKKELKGQKPDKVEKQDNGTIIIVKDGATFIANSQVYNLYSKDQDINDHMEKLFEKLSDNPEIEGLLVDSNKAEGFHADSADFPVLAQKNELLEDVEKIDTVHGVSLSIIKVVFQKNRKWEFIHNGTKISALIADDVFWGQIDIGKSFAKGDILTVDLEITKSFDNELQCYLNKSFKVIRVIDYKRRPLQEELYK